MNVERMARMRKSSGTQMEEEEEGETKNRKTDSIQ